MTIVIDNLLLISPPGRPSGFARYVANIAIRRIVVPCPPGIGQTTPGTA